VEPGCPRRLLIRSALITRHDGDVVNDVRIAGSRIEEVAAALPRRPGEEVMDAERGQLTPGLHDHHVHLFALAAASRSIKAGPPEISTEAQLGAALREADGRLAPGEWIRAVGYHDSVAGLIDRVYLDAVVPDRPVRVQHRSGVLWVLNTPALDSLRVGDTGPPGLERDAGGRATGRLWREDKWLRSRVPRRMPDIRAVSQAAIAAGITGFTDATPHGSAADVIDLAEAAADGRIAQRLYVMSAPGVTPPSLPVALGPAKILLDDDRLPSLDDLIRFIEECHAAGRRVAIHCVTAVQSAVAVAAFEAAGNSAGDRIEHGAVLNAGVLPVIRRLGLTVVTQPAFVVARGDQYLQDVDEPDRPDLWRVRSLLDAGIGVAASSDAPFGPWQPALAVRAAATRITSGGRPLGPDERIPGLAALSLFFGHPEEPGRARTVAACQPADLCLFDGPIRAGPDLPPVRATIIDGELVYRAST
jgi:predicted amidohydrolase YtcJ